MRLFRRTLSSLAAQAKPQKIASSTPAQTARKIDPYTLVTPELARCKTTLLSLLGSSNPSLTHIAQYYFNHPSKQIRPLLVLLFSKATNSLGTAWPKKVIHAQMERGRAEELDRPLTRPDVLNDWNPQMPDHTSSFQGVFEMQKPPPKHNRPAPLALTPPTAFESGQILPTQYRLAQIVEMVHVASLLHDDVLDASPLRRSAPSAPAAFGNKRTVLAGDFLLGRTSAALSRIGDSEVVELISCVISNLVEGEMLQLRDILGRPEDPGAPPMPYSPEVAKEAWNIYMKKTYLKTASLMAKGARAAVVLGGCTEGEIWKEAAYAYGRNLGIAFQLVDDVLDCESAEATLGKPGGADLALGIATGPALFAWEEHPKLGPLIARKFSLPGDPAAARELVQRSSGVERTRALARAYAEKAREVLSVLPTSEARSALEVLTERVVERTW